MRDTGTRSSKGVQAGRRVSGRGHSRAHEDRKSVGHERSIRWAPRGGWKPHTSLLDRPRRVPLFARRGFFCGFGREVFERFCSSLMGKLCRKDVRCLRLAGAACPGAFGGVVAWA